MLTRESFFSLLQYFMPYLWFNGDLFQVGSDLEYIDQEGLLMKALKKLMVSKKLHFNETGCFDEILVHWQHFEMLK